MLYQESRGPDVRPRAPSKRIGGGTAYRVEVKNTGSLAGHRVGVTATVPPRLRALTASG
jgi:hypothetical protein